MIRPTFVTTRIIGVVLGRLWLPLPFVWFVLVMATRWCVDQVSCVHEAGFLLILSLMAMEYGWLQGKTLGVHEKLSGAGVSPLRLYMAHIVVWFLLLSPCILWMVYGYGWHLGLSLVFFFLAPLSTLGVFLWFGRSRLFHYLVFFIPLQVPYFLLLQGALDPNRWIEPCAGLLGVACVGLALMGLSLPSVPSAAAYALQYCFLEPKPASDFLPKIS